MPSKLLFRISAKRSSVLIICTFLTLLIFYFTAKEQKPENEAPHDVRAFIQDLGKEIFKHLGTRSAFITPRDLVDFVSTKYLTPEGRDMLNVVLETIGAGTKNN